MQAGDANGMPGGITFVGLEEWSEPLLLEIASGFSALRNWRRAPTLAPSADALRASLEAERRGSGRSTE
jgi:hypothetical protein